MEKGVKVESDDGFSVITFANPNKNNALDIELLDSIRSAVTGLELEANRCLILRGGGDRVFSSGYDVSALPIGGSDEEKLDFARLNPLKKACDALMDYPYPVICMLNGSAYGGALELAVSCDLRLARDGMRVGMPPCRLGVIYSPEGIWKFYRLIGPAKTKELFFGADPMNIEEAWRIGLVNDIVPREEQLKHCLTLAGKIASHAPLSIKGHKHIFRSLEIGPPLNVDQQDEILNLTFEAFESDDLREGAAAFLEGRLPQFKGK